MSHAEGPAFEFLLDHFGKVIGPTAQRMRAGAIDLTQDALEGYVRDQQTLGNHSLALGIALLAAARFNNDSRSMIEMMLLHAETRQKNGVWP